MTALIGDEASEGSIFGVGGNISRGVREITPHVARDIENCAREQLREYGRFLYQKSDATTCSISQASFLLLCQAIAKSTRGKLYPLATDAAISELTQSRVIQTGPHTQLLLDPVTLGAYLVSCIGAREMGYRNFFLFSVSTITLHSGPWRVGLNSELIPVFKLSRKTLSRNVATCAPLAGGVTFSDRLLDLFQSQHASLSSAAFSTPADALLHANALLWRVWTNGNGPQPIVLDERFVSSLVVEHLASDGSFLKQLLFDPDRLARLFSELEAYRAGPQAGFLKWSTDFFWRVRDGRIRKLELRDGLLREADQPNEWRLTWEPEAIAEGLQHQLIVPSLFVSYLVISILPIVRALGGPFMIAYYPQYINLLKVMLRRDCREEADFESCLTAAHLSRLGMCLIAPPYDANFVARIFSGSDFWATLDELSNMSLARVAMNFEIFSRIPAWREYSAH